MSPFCLQIDLQVVEEVEEAEEKFAKEVSGAQADPNAQMPLNNFQSVESLSKEHLAPFSAGVFFSPPLKNMSEIASVCISRKDDL